MQQYHWFSLLALPLFAGDDVIVWVGRPTRTARVFSPEIVRLAKRLAHSSRERVQNARLFQRTHAALKKSDRVESAARLVGARATLDEMLEIIESETATVVPTDAFFIALYDSATELVDFVRVTDYGVRQPSFQWRLGPSLTRRVITSTRALRLDDRQEYSSLDNPPQSYGDGTTLPRLAWRADSLWR